MAGTRRQARTATLQVLYELDCTKHEVEGILTRLRAGEIFTQEALGFTEELVQGVIRNKSDIDALIKRFAPAFPAEQMSIVDRNILRLAIFEILFNDKTPFKVAINEAVELAKSFGSNSSPRLINGVLGSIANRHGTKQVEPHQGA